MQQVDDLAVERAVIGRGALAQERVEIGWQAQGDARLFGHVTPLYNRQDTMGRPLGCTIIQRPAMDGTERFDSRAYRRALADTLRADGHLRSARIAEAIEAVPRELFVPGVPL